AADACGGAAASLAQDDRDDAAEHPLPVRIAPRQPHRASSGERLTDVEVAERIGEGHSPHGAEAELPSSAELDLHALRLAAVESGEAGRPDAAPHFERLAALAARRWEVDRHSECREHCLRRAVLELEAAGEPTGGTGPRRVGQQVLIEGGDPRVPER